MDSNAGHTGLVLGAANAPLAAEPADTAPTVTTLETIRISATPLDTSALASATPVEVLDGSALLLKRQATLGDTLDGMLGIHSDTFGAGASRPVIRGQAAPRVKVLSNGSELMDASAVSPDHAVTAEPMLVERIEVLRGPSAQLYGGSAIGGVVNVIDRKVPVAVPADGIEGQMEIRGTSGSDGRTGLFSLTAGEGNVAVHVEGLKLRADDYAVPDWPALNESACGPDTLAHRTGRTLRLATNPPGQQPARIYTERTVLFGGSRLGFSPGIQRGTVILALTAFAERAGTVRGRCASGHQYL